MRDLLSCYILSKPEQYEDVMKILYENEVFPMEYDPEDLQDYIDNFDFSEKIDGLLKYGILYRKENNMRGIKDSLRNLLVYNSELDLPRLELEDVTAE